MAGAILELTDEEMAMLEPPRGLHLPAPFRCPLLSKLSCAFSPVGGGSRVFTVRLDYVETPLGTARPITQAVDKVQGGSCG